jgi:Holliday junction DNA helicase RuvA
MIASLRGPVLALTAGGAVIECGGVGLAVTLTPAARSGLRLGQEGQVTTHLVVREDALSLYGFADDAERRAFLAVQQVSGIGPRIALAVVATMSPDVLAKAVAGGDVAALTRVPGIGRKGAQKLILELSGKLTETGGVSGPGAPAGGDALSEQVTAALTGLGWPQAQAAQAVAKVLAPADAPAEPGEVLRAALRTLGGGRG